MRQFRLQTQLTASVVPLSLNNVSVAGSDADIESSEMLVGSDQSVLVKWTVTADEAAPTYGVCTDGDDLDMQASESGPLAMMPTAVGGDKT